MPSIAAAAAQLPVENALLDGEGVALDKHGIANFADLQAAFQEGRENQLTDFAFDLLHLDGHNTRKLPLLERKELLAEMLAQSGRNLPLRFSEHFKARGGEVFAKAYELGAEDIASRLASSTYDSGRGHAWLKIKSIQDAEVGDRRLYTAVEGRARHWRTAAGVLPRRQADLCGASRDRIHGEDDRALRTQLDKLIQEKALFAEIPREARRDAIWVKPQLVAQVAFTTWTRDNLIRQASFKDLRKDKPAREVVREMPVAAGAGILKQPVAGSR